VWVRCALHESGCHVLAIMSGCHLVARVTGRDRYWRFFFCAGLEKKKVRSCNWKIAFLRVTLPRADGTAWQRDQEKAGASIGHPLNHDSSNAGVIRSKRTVNQCVGVKRTYNFWSAWSGCQLFRSRQKMSDLGDSR
jgi:hypothetical protein